MEVRPSWPFGAGARRIEVPVGGRLVSDDFVVLRTAAEQGLGIARLPGLLVHDGIQAGRLVALLDDQAPPPNPLHLLYPGGGRLPARTRAFIEFVQPRLAQALASGSTIARPEAAVRPLHTIEP
jgi:DNA-binding transcriptional LysR family regulator